MGFSGIYLSHVTALLSSVIIGVGVDFLFTIIFKANRTKDKSDKNSTETFNEVGYPIVLDSASNMSFGALIFSNFYLCNLLGINGFCNACNFCGNTYFISFFN